MTASRPYVQVARAAASDRTRTSLLDAAEAAFFDGTGDITLDEVASRAGVTKQTLLRHFGSKEGLLEQAWARAYERVREQRMSAPASDVEGAVDNLLAHYDDVGRRALKLESMGDEGIGVELRRRGRELHYEWVDRSFAPWLEARRGRSRTRLRASLIAMCDVRTWALLTYDLELPRSEVRATLVESIRKLTEVET